MTNFFKKSLMVSAIAIAVAGCNSGSSSSSGGSGGNNVSASDGTTFNVAVDAPDSLLQAQALNWDQKISQFFVPAAMAVDGDDLSAENFTVVVVDAQGKVVEEVTITSDNIEKLPDGTWEISLPGDPRLDCLIVVDINKPVQITVGEDVPADALFAPTTAVDIDVDIASTAAYQNFIEELDAQPGETFSELGLDVDNADDVAAIEAIVERVQEVYEELVNNDDVNLTLGSISEFMDEIEGKVSLIIEQEIDNALNATTGTIAELIISGGLFWYDGEFDQVGNTTELEVDEIERGKVSETGVETFVEYDDVTNDWAESETFAPGDTADDDLILTANGWENSADAFQVTSINADGSVTIQDAAISSVQEVISAVQVTDLSGRNIEDFMDISSGDFSLIIESDATFTEGAKAYRLSFTNVNDEYSLWYQGGDESTGQCPWSDQNASTFGGNCETVDIINGGDYQGDVEVLSDLISATATVVVDGGDDTNFKGLILESSNNAQIVTELVYDAGKTANFYLYDGEIYETLASGSWAYQKPAGLPEGEQIVVVEIPEAVLEEGDFDEDEKVFIFAEDAGFVRKGNFIAANTVSEETDGWVFNAAANTNILAAVDFDFLDTLSVDGNSESEGSDEAYDGFGGPLNGSAYTYKAFERDVSLARNDSADYDFTVEELSGNTFYDYADAMTFNADGSGVSESTENGDMPFTWEVNDDGFLVVSFSVTDEMGDSSQSYTFSAQDIHAKVPGDEGISLKIFFQNDLWQQIGSNVTDEPEITANQGEIWTNTWYDTVQQPR